ncbi:unnamed protein product [Cercospora beticola]|nr:unnamed protein product [Cercospora beticola]
MHYRHICIYKIYTASPSVLLFLCFTTHLNRPKPKACERIQLPFRTNAYLEGTMSRVIVFWRESKRGGMRYPWGSHHFSWWCLLFGKFLGKSGFSRDEQEIIWMLLVYHPAAAVNQYQKQPESGAGLHCN